MLSDPAAAEVKEVKQLRTRTHRRKTGCVIVEGYPEVSRAVQAGVPVECLYVCPEIFSPGPGEFDHLAGVLRPVTREVFAAMAFGSRLKGILAICRPRPLSLEDLRTPEGATLVILEAVEKPGNLGAVLRTADGAGVCGVIMCDGKTDIYNQHVVRSSIGTVFTVPVVSTDAETLKSFLTERGFTTLAATAHTDLEYTDADMTGRTAIIVGNEHCGISEFWRTRSDRMIRIPMAGKASSLNVTVSASILIYEARRQKSR